jgi:hypothetical protein
MNARSTPGGVLRHHLENQIPNFSRNLLAAGSPAHFAEHGPIQAESSAVPAGHSVRSDQIEALLPVGPELAKGNPKQLVEQTQFGFRMPAFQDEELLAKSEVLQHQVLARTKEAKGDSEPDPQKVEHGGIVIPDRILIRASMSLISQSDGIVASHTNNLVPPTVEIKGGKGFAELQESSRRKAKQLTLRCPLIRQMGLKVPECHFGGLPTIQNAFRDIGSQECKLKDPAHVPFVKASCFCNRPAPS